MTKASAYTIRMPYATCETLMNNETISEAVAVKRKLRRTVNSRVLDNKAISGGATVDVLRTGQVYKERCSVVDTHAGKMQRAFGFHQWQQDFKMEKTGEDMARCVDSLLWKQTGSTAYRTYTIRGSGDAAVIMSLNPWVINLQNVSFEGMIRKRMEKEMSASDAQFPALCESAARNHHRRVA